MAEYDDLAFDAMKKINKSKASNLFTESEYNVNATHKERMDYDLKAYSFLENLFQEDKAKISDIKDWDFDRYLANLKNSYMKKNCINAKKEDPAFYGKAGDMLRSVYSDDVDQLKLSASNVSAQMKPTWEYGDDEWSKRARDRSNVSIKAPGAERY